MLWSTEVEAQGNSQALNPRLYPNGGVGNDDGPRSTPIVDGGSVYVLSSYHKLSRLNATNGAIIWQTNLAAGFGGSVIAWQNAAFALA
jgi:outer membrane protein assembly factor BamB